MSSREAEGFWGDTTLAGIVKALLALITTLCWSALHTSLWLCWSPLSGIAEIVFSLAGHGVARKGRSDRMAKFSRTSAR